MKKISMIFLSAVAFLSIDAMESLRRVITPDVAADFGRRCLGGRPLEVHEMLEVETEFTNTPGYVDPLIFSLGDRHLVKVVRQRAHSEIDSADRLYEAIREKRWDTALLNFGIPTRYAYITFLRAGAAVLGEVYDIRSGDCGFGPWAAELLEKAPGVTLHALLDQEYHESTRNLCKVFFRLGKAVKTMHKLGISHKNLHSGNVIVDFFPGEEAHSSFTFIDFDGWRPFDAKSKYLHEDCEKILHTLIRIIPFFGKVVWNYLGNFARGYKGYSLRRYLISERSLEWYRNWENDYYFDKGVIRLMPACGPTRGLSSGFYSKLNRIFPIEKSRDKRR